MLVSTTNSTSIHIVETNNYGTLQLKGITHILDATNLAIKDLHILCYGKH